MCTAQLMGTFTTYLLRNDKELPNKQTKAFPLSFFNKATDKVKGPVAGRYFSSQMTFLTFTTFLTEMAGILHV